MNIHTTDGTRIRTTPTDLLAMKGKRSLYLLGTSVEQTNKGRQLLADHSFNKLFTSAQRSPSPVSRNTRYIAL